MSAVSVSQSGVRPILADAVDVARRALLELEPTGVGAHLGVTAEDEAAATHRFEATLSGYRGWQWAVVVAAPPGAIYATVSESALLPGPDALVAPDFIPWEQRIRPGDLAPGDLLAPLVNDPRLVPGYVVSGDPAVDEVAMEIGLGRTKVLSREGREEATERWYSEFGPETDMAKAAPSTCGRCGFYLPLAGSLRAAFGVCGNAMGADGRVVHVEYGCGAHSDVEVPTGGGSPLYEAYDDAAFDVIAPEAPRKPDSGAASSAPAETAAEAAPATGPTIETPQDASTAAESDASNAAEPNVEQSVEVPNGQGALAPSESTAEAASDLTVPTSVEPGAVPASGDVVAEPITADGSGVEAAPSDAAVQSRDALESDVDAAPGDAAAESNTAVEQDPSAPTATSADAVAGPTPAATAEPITVEPGSRAGGEAESNGAAAISDAAGEVAPETVVTAGSGDAAAVERSAEAFVSEPGSGAGAAASDQDVVESGSDAVVSQPGSGADGLGDAEAAVSEPGAGAGAASSDEDVVEPGAEGAVSQSESSSEAAVGAADEVVGGEAAGADGEASGAGDRSGPGAAERPEFGSSLQG